MIQRQITAALLKGLTFFPVVSIVGPRQVGKTTLAKMLQGQLGKPSLYMDLELDSDRTRLSRAEWFLAQHADKCVIIDEVQRMPDLFPLLRALVDQKREPAKFILLGSASPDLLRQSSESLAGRIAYFELTPFCLAEVADRMTLQEHWFRGGFPVACLAPDLSFAQDWYAQFVQSFVERDLRTMGVEVNPVLFDRLFRMLGHLHGGQVNAAELSGSLGISTATVNRYLDLLEHSFLIVRLQPWFTNLGKRLVKSPKLYLRDTGLLHYLLFAPSFYALQGHPGIGASWEGYVIEEIRRSLAGRGKLFYYRTHGGAEIDLVVETASGRRVCIEIKYDVRPVPSRGFYEGVNDLKPDGQYIIVPQGAAWPYNQHITIIGLEAFLSTDALR